MSLVSAMQWRYAVKKYDISKTIADEQLQQLLEAVRLAPTSFNLQPFRFLIVSNPETRTRLRQEAAYGQPQVTESSHLIVIAAETDVDERTIARSIDLAAKTRNALRESMADREAQIKAFLLPNSPEERTQWAKRQAYLALGVLIGAGAEARVDVSSMEGFQPSKADEILGLPEKSLTSTVLVAVGIRSEQDAFASLAKVRKPMEEIFQTL